jgi:hypothetical protein
MSLTDAQFAEEVARRRTALNLKEGQTVPGCPLCALSKTPGGPTLPAAGVGGRSQ